MTETFVSTMITAYMPENTAALLERDKNLGGDIGSNEIVTSLLYNFAPDIDRDTIGKPGVKPGQWAIYYLFYLYNKSVESTVQNVTMWIYRAPSDPNIGVALGLDPVGKNGVAQHIPNKTTPPTGVTFKSPMTATSTTVIKLDVLAPGDKLPVWVKCFGNKGIETISQVSYGIMFKFLRPASP